MTSILKVDNIQNSSGTAAVAIDGSANITIPQNATISGAVTGMTLSDNIVFNTANKGVYLGVTSANATNLLNDYEEGTWTPAIYYQNADDQTNSANVTQSGVYTKIGNIVIATCYLKFSATNSRANDNIAVTGLPFVASNSAPNSETRWTCSVMVKNSSLSASADASTMGFLSNNQSVVNFLDAVHNGNLGDEFGQNTNMEVKFTLTYHTDL